VHKLAINQINLDGNVIQGSGAHPQHGNFVLEGTHNNGKKLEFRVKFNDRELFFSGKKSGYTLKGKWGMNQEEDIGSWKFTYIVPKQGWNGSYEQAGIENDMDFSEFNIENVPNGTVKAKGSDENGDFGLDGTYDPASQQVRLSKIYDSGIEWNYWGTVVGNAIEGNWGANFG